MNNDIIQVLMTRDGMSHDEAVATLMVVITDLSNMINEGCGLTELEDYFMDELGLEPDYMDEIMMSLTV